MKEKTILIICIAFMLTFPLCLASAPQITEFNPENETWVNSESQEINITIEAEECRYSDEEGVEWENKKNMSILEEDKFNASVNLDEGTNEIYFQCNDTDEGLTDDALYILNLDQQPPEAGSIAVNDGEKYTTSDSVNVTWDGFSDEISGIKYYYYNYTDNSEPIQVSNSTTKVEINGLDEGNITINVWA